MHLALQIDVSIKYLIPFNTNCNRLGCKMSRWDTGKYGHSALHVRGALSKRKVAIDKHYKGHHWTSIQIFLYFGDS
jgi:hypothetical protein